MNLYDGLIWNAIGGDSGGGLSVEELSVTSNGYYSAPSGTAYSPINVNVPATTPDTAAIVLARNVPSLSNYTNTDATVVGQYGFAYFNIGSKTSQGITTYGTITLPNVTTVSAMAFLSVGAEEVIMPSLANITGYSAFISARIRRASYPLLTKVPSSAFAYCTSLSEVYLPSVSSVGGSTFYMCHNNPFSVTFGSLLTDMGTGAFASCIYLSEAVFSNLKAIPQTAFSSCREMKMASFAVASSVGNYAFYSCYNLLSLYLLSTSVTTLGGVSAFANTPISTRTDSTSGVHGSIFVRESLYSDYLVANNWSAYSDRIVSLTDAQIAALG